MADISKYFKPDSKEVKSHSLGYVNFDEVDKISLSPEAVIDCENMDFHPQYDRRRDPYLLYSDLSTILPNGYSIVRAAEKVFFDKDGISQKVLIVTAKGSRTTDKLKIYMSHWYVADTVCANSMRYGSIALGWKEEWTQLTERYSSHADQPAEEQIYDFEYKRRGFESNYYDLKSANPIFNKNPNYFRGFYVADRNTDVCGIVAESKWISGAAYFRLDTDVKDAADFKDTAAPFVTRVSIFRFPCIEFNRDHWANIETVDINTEFPQRVLMSFGDKSRPVLIKFLQDKVDFNGQTVIPAYNGGLTAAQVTTRNQWNGDIDDLGNLGRRFKVTITHKGSLTGAATSYHSWQIHVETFNKDNVSEGNDLKKARYQTVTGVNDTFKCEIELEKGLMAVVNITLGIENTTSRYAEFTVRKKDANTTRWNGFWCRFDSPKVNNKKIWNYNSDTIEDMSVGTDLLGKELGIDYEITQKVSGATSGTADYNRVYACCVELDGNNVYFVKYFYTQARTLLKIQVRFHKYYDRSISGHLLFHDSAETELYAPSPNDAHDAIISKPSYLLNDAMGGRRATDNMLAPLNSDYNTWNYEIIGKLSEDPTADDTIKSFATETKLQDMLNNYYYKDVTVQSVKVIRVGDNALGMNLYFDKSDQESKNVTFDTKMAVVLSQLQNANVHTPGIMCTERMIPLSKGMEILAGAPTINRQFLIFTGVDCRWCEIIDEDNVNIVTHGTFDEKGIFNADGVVRAIQVLESQTGPLTSPSTTQYSGVFFASKDGIYAFYDNKPVNLLEILDANQRKIGSTWQEEYMAIVNKAGIIGGYRASTKDVWYVVPFASGTKVMVWNVTSRQWKIYSINETIVHFLTEENGEIFMVTANKIYKSEPVGTSSWKDKGTVDIPFKWRSGYGHGDSTHYKIPDMVELNYEADLHTKGEVLALKAGRNGDLDNAIDTTIEIAQGESFFKRGTKQRIPCNYWTVQFESDGVGVKEFKVTNQKVTAVMNLTTTISGR